MVKLLILLLFLVGGVLLQRFLSAKTLTKLFFYLNRFVIYISLPAMVLVYLNNIRFNSSFFIPVVVSWGVFIFSALILYIVAKFLDYSKEMLIAFIMLVSFTNSSFLGIPFTKVFFGEEGISYAIIYDQLGSFLILSTFGVIILSLYGIKKLNIKEIIVKVITFPSFIALIFTLVFQDINYPSWLFEILKNLSNILAPAALVSIGLNLVIKVPKDEFKHMVTALFLKLIAIPLILIAIFRVLDINSLSAKVSIFESAMAPMVTACMLAIVANIKPRFVATTLGYGIVLSFITLPLIYIFFLKS
jgi:predicted permease